MAYTEYTWIFVLGTIFSFISAFGIGANDVANSFASSVGAKAITITQAVLIASVCEFSGAVGLGASVTSTIKSGITNVSYFKDTPDLFMYGMFCVLIAAAFWDNMACHLELPVSTTHTTVGAIVGMTMTLRGGGAVIWSQEQDEFPYIKGMVSIFISWFASPIAAGIVVMIVFGFIRTFVLRSENSFNRGYYLLPFFTFVTFFVIVLFIIQTGNKQGSWDEVADGKAVWISLVIGGVLGVLTLFVVMPVLRRWVLEEEEKRERIKDVEDKEGQEGKTLSGEDDVQGDSWWSRLSDKTSDYANNNAVGRILFKNPVSKALSTGINVNIHETVKNDETVAGVWEHAEVFDTKTEALFRYLQVFSAMTMSFAHGSNDVANAVGPYAAIYYVYKNKKVPGSKTSVPQWIYVMGGVGFVLGLATYGHHIMRVLGVKVAKLTNSRGFAAELSTAIVVLVASRYGLPISTTQTICGAILAIGLFEGTKGVNWFVALRTFGGWTITLFVAGFVSAAFTAFGAFSPRKITADQIVTVRKEMLKQILAMKTQISNDNLSQTTFNITLNDTLNSITSSFSNFNKTTDGYIHVENLVALQKKTLALFNQTLVLDG